MCIYYINDLNASYARLNPIISKGEKINHQIYTYIHEEQKIVSGKEEREREENIRKTTKGRKVCVNVYIW